jgi:2-C-methyl-D-erythritol 4-phosphate cytidylyltransferase / 2-C-methyl-D-erythritol 2,4-cyclodiphosphate synthase
MMSQKQPFTALILAGGHGSRMNTDIPKQYQILCGQTVIHHAIKTFLAHPSLIGIRVVIDPTHLSLYEDAVRDLHLPVPIYGGKTRMESCYNGLKALNLNQDELILIHDAARPLVSIEDIDNVLEALTNQRSVSLGVPISETLRRSNDENILHESIDRTNIWALQTPQGFHYQDLKTAHEKTKNHDGFTDDCSVMEAAGHQTYIVKGGRHNIKITWQNDIQECANYMNTSSTQLIGQGFDVHAFGDEGVKTIRLGGIDIPYIRKLTAHSDGDVVLHALTDALLGAIAAGDIGQHFPPSDMQWKDKDSTFFLNEACRMIAEKNCTINNVDVTIMCEAPKIGPVRDEMQSKIAELLSLPLHRVNVKATTTEKLGFTGRGEGIAVQVTTLLTEHIS